MKNNPKLFSGPKVGQTSRDQRKMEKARDRSQQRKENAEPEAQQNIDTSPEPEEPDS